MNYGEQVLLLYIMLKRLGSYSPELPEKERDDKTEINGVTLTVRPKVTIQMYVVLYSQSCREPTVARRCVIFLPDQSLLPPGQ